MRSDGCPLQALAWLEGAWRGEGPYASLEQHYGSARGATILGTSRRIVDGQSPHREFLLFEALPDASIRLTIVDPSHHETVYALRACADGVAVFASVAGPPQRVVFTRLSHARMRIGYEKKTDAGAKAYEFLLVRPDKSDALVRLEAASDPIHAPTTRFDSAAGSDSASTA